MTRSRLIAGLLTLALLVLVLFISRNTQWEDVPIPTPPKGEAVTNPFYIAERFAEAVGARPRRERSVVLPPAGGVVVLSAWHWDLTEQRQSAIKQWVESGGRLVLDDQITGGEAFAQWSGVDRDFNEAVSDAHMENQAAPNKPCTPLQEVSPQPGPTYITCDLDFSFLTASRPVEWALSNDTGLQAVRVTVGQGSVTVINAKPFTWLSLLSSDHARLFVAATQLERGDEVVFLSEDDHASLLTLLWRYGSPAVALGLLAVSLFLWRGAIRFGPPLPRPEPRRRSMAEQIRGSGRFVMKHGDGGPLHAAAVRALSEAARRKIPAYSHLSRPQRVAALGRATGMDGAAIVAAIESVSKRRANELANTLALLETARRQLLSSGA